MPVTPETAAQELRDLDDPSLPDWLVALRDPQALTRAGRPDHLTASGLLVDPSGTSTLLVLHGKVGRWLQPGGHLEPGDTSLAAAALRESTEETGVAGLVVDPLPLLLDRHPAPCGARDHLDVQFLVRAPGRAAPVVSDESADVQWWPLDGLPEPRVDLDRLVGAARARLRAGGA